MTDITKDQPIINEWSVPFNPLKIKDTGTHQVIEANEEERKNLARRFDLIAIDSLSAKLVVNNSKASHVVHVTGSFTAQIQQPCVVSDEPVTTDIAEDVEGWFADPAQIVSLHKARREKAIKDGNELPILEEEEDPEPFVNGQIDLGEFIAQNLSLAIPAYPRADGVSFDGHSTDASEEHKKAFRNPFEALKDWKKETDNS